MKARAPKQRVPALGCECHFPHCRTKAWLLLDQLFEWVPDRRCGRRFWSIIRHGSMVSEWPIRTLYVMLPC